MISVAAAREVVGLLPAGGQASRISPLPCSKELFPVGFRPSADGRGSRQKVVAHYLLEHMHVAGIKKAYIVLRQGKWDIPAYFGDGSMLGMHIGYLMLGLPFGVPFTLDQAYPFVRDAVVAFGFPDILIDSADPFGTLLNHQAKSQADITLGLCPATHPASPEDRVEIDEKHDVQRIVVRPSESSLTYGWAVALWQPTFTDFLHRYVASETATAAESEPSAGHAIQAGIQAGLRVDGVVISEDPYLDIGTPGGLASAIRRGIERDEGD